VISPLDDSLHDPGGDTYWNESAWFPISIPERSISGWVMVVHRPNMRSSIGGLALWDPSGENAYDCLFYDWGDGWAFDPAWDMFDCDLPNWMTVSTFRPLEALHVSYLRDECQADLTWEASAEPFESPPAFRADVPGSGHFEQPGRMTGTISVRGDILHVDCPSIRDRSWGPRTPTPLPRADAPWALDEDGDGFHVYAEATSEIVYDRVDGTTEKLVSGWNRADGVTRPLVSGSRRAVSRGEDGRPLRVEVRGTDDVGRELVADGECVNWLRWQGQAHTFQWWCLVRWQVRGGIAWGEVRESMPLQLSRRYHRGKGL
jgi:hypothetical protein